MNLKDIKTAEEIAQWVIDNRFPKSEKEKISDVEMYQELVKSIEKLKEIPVKIRKISEDELKTGFNMYLTVGQLKEFLNKHNLPDDAIVLIQRVEDFYFEENNWAVFLKKSDWWHRINEYNKKVKSGEFLDKKKYPEMTPEMIEEFSEEDMEKAMNQYIPVWCCVKYEDDDGLFLDAHY